MIFTHPLANKPAMPLELTVGVVAEVAVRRDDAESSLTSMWVWLMDSAGKLPPGGELVTWKELAISA